MTMSNVNGVNNLDHIGALVRPSDATRSPSDTQTTMLGHSSQSAPTQSLDHLHQEKRIQENPFAQNLKPVPLTSKPVDSEPTDLNHPASQLRVVYAAISDSPTPSADSPDVIPGTNGAQPGPGTDTVDISKEAQAAIEGETDAGAPTVDQQESPDPSSESNGTETASQAAQPQHGRTETGADRAGPAEPIPESTEEPAQALGPAEEALPEPANEPVNEQDQNPAAKAAATDQGTGPEQTSPDTSAAGRLGTSTSESAAPGTSTAQEDHVDTAAPEDLHPAHEQQDETQAQETPGQQTSEPASTGPDGEDSDGAPASDGYQRPLSAIELVNQDFAAEFEQQLSLLSGGHLDPESLFLFGPRASLQFAVLFQKALSLLALSVSRMDWAEFHVPYAIQRDNAPSPMAVPATAEETQA